MTIEERERERNLVEENSNYFPSNFMKEDNIEGGSS